MCVSPLGNGPSPEQCVVSRQHQTSRAAASALPLALPVPLSGGTSALWALCVFQPLLPGVSVLGGFA
ncbi:hypothetical protein XENTR_v10016942 [Xenopus tropicalis]|nr:hypothetical protein XENTR_v10016942 [Xenopus tropicalis]